MITTQVVPTLEVTLSAPRCETVASYFPHYTYKILFPISCPEDIEFAKLAKSPIREFFTNKIYGRKIFLDFQEYTFFRKGKKFLVFQAMVYAPRLGSWEEELRAFLAEGNY